MLSSGTREDRTWSVPVRDLDGLTLISDTEFQGPFDVKIELRNSRNFITAKHTLSVNIEPFQPANTRNGQTVVAESESDVSTSQTQNIIRSTSIIGAEKSPLQRQTKTVPLVGNGQVPVRQPSSQLSPSLSAGLLARGNRFLQNGDIAEQSFPKSIHLSFQEHRASVFSGLDKHPFHRRFIDTVHLHPQRKQHRFFPGTGHGNFFTRHIGSRIDAGTLHDHDAQRVSLVRTVNGFQRHAGLDCMGRNNRIGPTEIRLFRSNHFGCVG